MSDELLIFLLFTIVFMGGAGFLTGQAIASTWRSVWQLAAYGLILAAFDRFLIYALFEGQLLSLSGYVIDCFVIMLIAFLGFKRTRARIMVKQYPWLYERKGLIGWGDIDGA
jgi:branched-chain amino acid transport system ATP-binding protein